MTQKPQTTRDHGGNLDAAIAAFGGSRMDWIDLSTGINPLPYPVPEIPPHAWSTLPTNDAVKALEDAASRAYGTTAEIVALAGAQAAIQLVPRIGNGRDARVLGPTYNEHAAALTAQGWDVTTVDRFEALRGAALAVVVNPNNPDGQCWAPGALTELAGAVDLLVVDESFADPCSDLSLAPKLSDHRNILVLRSFGKFYGLAGLRLGFALGSRAHIDRIRTLAGPWAVNGPAIVTGCAALEDRDWTQATRARLTRDAARLDALATRAGWSLVGGTPLFRTYETGDATAAQTHLARHHIWSRIFPYSRTWLRLGLAGPETDWLRLDRALSELA
ncbi:threonine-phosphate decarboxylase CobD [Primorskyibacter aestuariivivens]|uniref:threonine-phosphate decarboxylase CobD n=1 Tax=Primorskyibacter aestuariivivens TaxID=1888912 RepID=UPI0023000359|nr:threonine-phosphate decarboxylase CobD [Primorskyibacter aestuariivivens]MDA7428007.1 threonine-phosphate decarboxylase CobD [Primorskyibacter aestuariivivens]